MKGALYNGTRKKTQESLREQKNKLCIATMTKIVVITDQQSEIRTDGKPQERKRADAETETAEDLEATQINMK